MKKPRKKNPRTEAALELGAVLSSLGYGPGQAVAIGLELMDLARKVRRVKKIGPSLTNRINDLFDGRGCNVYYTQKLLLLELPSGYANNWDQKLYEVPRN